MKKLIVISDWVADGLRCQELRTIVEGYLNNPFHPYISFVASSHSSVHAGFLTDQLAAVEERFGRPLETIIFVDLPASDSELLMVRLKTGLYVIGTNKGNVFSLVKKNAEAIFHYPDLEKQTEFRKRDQYYRVLAHFLESKQDDLELEEVHESQVPEIQDYIVGHIDSYGNLKTSIVESDIKEKYSHNDIIDITIQNITKSVRYVKSLDDADIGELVLYPGSAGDMKDRYMDVAVCTDFKSIAPNTAVREFDRPAPGCIVEIMK